MKPLLTNSAMLLGLFLTGQGFQAVAMKAKPLSTSAARNPTAASALVADYQFRGLLGSAVSNAPALTNLGSNAFESVTVDDSTRQALNFDPNNGLAF